MTRLRVFLVASAFVSFLVPLAARAAVHVGDVAPPFSKNELVSTPFPQAGPLRSLSDYAGRVLVIHLLGWY
jgi:hypothetical protein